jgi:signal transduction histidine kinase
MAAPAFTAPKVPRPRRRLFWKYVVVIVALVTAVLVASAGVELWFSYRENQDAITALQYEKAGAAATRIEVFIREIERQMGWTTQPLLASGTAALEQRRIDFLRLLRQVPPITELSHVDAEGMEQLRVSRLAMDVAGSGADLSGDPRFTEAVARRKACERAPNSCTSTAYHGPVYFRKESEPYMVVTMAQSGGGVTVAEVNLKFIWDVVTQIKIGKAGRAYVVDEAGNLIAHPDISLVLQKTSLAGLPQVRAALTAGARGSPVARDIHGKRVLSAHATIPGLRWAVFTEQPLEEALAPLQATLKRSLALLAIGIGLAIGASVLLARRMVRPIQALQVGAARIAGGELGHRIEVKSADELQALAGEFNRMTEHLQESYATLEQRVEDRTRELTESLEQQTATGEILRVISAAQTDVQPVFDAIAASSVSLCSAVFSGVFLYDGEFVRLVGHHNWTPEALAEFEQSYPLRPARDATLVTWAILDAAVVHIPDIEAEPTVPEKSLRLARSRGYRSFLAVPMRRDGNPIGVIAVAKREAGPFSGKQVDILKTFADQAVIAIENVRLFKELEARNSALSESLEQQTATAEILRVISGSPTDIQPVLEVVAQNAARVCDANDAVIRRVEGDLMTQAAHFGSVPAEALPDVRRITRHSVSGRAVLERRTIHLVNLLDPEFAREYPEGAILQQQAGYRTIVATPLLREGVAVGVIMIRRMDPRAFTDKQLALLQTFADQAVIAIENVRLFTELQDRTSQLQVANRHKDEFLANMSHELRTPLNAIIGFSEVMLERMFGDINEKQEEYLNDILTSGRHLLSLINDILDLSKIEAGKMELDLTDFNLAVAIDNACTLVHERAARRGLTLAQDVDARIGDFRGDERKIKQVLLNLLSNAVKFTSEGGRVEVRATPKGDVVEISVSDTGVGIAPSDQETVFEEFRQVGTDTARKHEGTGLGLALARRFVELHGGNIWLESEVGVGSTFTFALPVRGS